MHVKTSNLKRMLPHAGWTPDGPKECAGPFVIFKASNINVLNFSSLNCDYTIIDIMEHVIKLIQCDN